MERPTGFRLIRNLIIWSFLFLIIFIVVEIAFDIYYEGRDLYETRQSLNYSQNDPFSKFSEMFEKVKVNPISKFRKIFMWLLFVSIPSLVGLVLISKSISNNKVSN